MAREITDPDGTLWTCIQAYAGLGNQPEKQEAAAAGAPRGKLHVVCTPRGGAKSVRLDLDAAWEKDLSDDALLTAIADAGA